MEDKSVSRTRKFNETPEQAIKRIHHEDADGDVTIHTEQDVTQTFAVNREDFKDRAGTRYDQFQNHVARIPTAIYYDLVKRGIIDEVNDPEGDQLRVWLNDPDNRAWRSRPGRI